MKLLLLIIAAILLSCSAFMAVNNGASARTQGKLYMQDPKNILIIGGTRFSGLYLWRELHKRGHHVTLFNRGKTAAKKLPRESNEEFAKRVAETAVIAGDRQDPNSMKTKLGGLKFDAIYDMNGREASDTAPLADMFNGKVDHFVYMSSAGVYKKSTVMPHVENDAEDVKSRHKGKLETESYLKQIGIPFTSIRPVYIYGPMNYNPLEEYFFTRVTAGRPVVIPGHGQHLTGLGHVEDLAVAMAQVIGNEKAKGQIYNIQDTQSVTFEGLARLCGQAAGMDPKDVQVKLYDKSKYDFGDKKAFPMREQHFFCSVNKAMTDLNWKPKYNLIQGLQDSYENDFNIKKGSGKLVEDFSADDIVLGATLV